MQRVNAYLINVLLFTFAYNCLIYVHMHVGISVELQKCEH